MTVTGANFNVSPFPTVRLGGVPAAVTSVNSGHIVDGSDRRERK